MPVSHSELECFARCPREHFYGYRLRRRPVKVATALVYGSQVGAALEDIQNGAPEVRMPAILPARALVRAYVKHYAGDPLRFLQSERWFDVGGVIGAFDALVEDPSGHRWIFETKTTTSDLGPGDLYRQKLPINAQNATYLDAADMLRLDVRGVIYNTLKKPAQRQKKGESAEDFEARIEREILADPGEHFQRFEAVLTRGERDALRAERAERVDALHRGATYRVSGACQRGREACSYLDVCTGAASIDDDRLFRLSPRRPAA